jgi:hypothetical protein
MANDSRNGFAGTSGTGNYVHVGEENHVIFTKAEIIDAIQQLDGIRRKLKQKLNTV